MLNFVFEILIEEIPHGVLPNTSQHIKDQLPILLSKYGVNYKSITYFMTPRRLAFYIEECPSKGNDRIIEQKGPSSKAAYDEQGNPTKALQGFFNSYNVTLSDIEEREIKGQKYLFIQKTEIGEDLEKILPIILKELIQGNKFPQPMRWNYNNEVYEFIRPVRGIMALLNDKILPVTFFGLESSNSTYGHRQLFPQAIVLSNANKYEEILKTHGCIPKFEEREQIIQDHVAAIVSSINGIALLDDELLSILASLTEYPYPLLATFDPEFLSLPKEVLISEMKVHQKYIPIIDQKGALLPNYIITANISYQDESTKKNILAGNDRVLRARFADGQFFFEEDSKKRLTYYADQLSSIAFIDGAGSIADKIERMKIIATYLTNILEPSIDQKDLIQAVSFSKADLSSLMVGEFPELQGIIGAYYAKNQGMSDDVVLAIREHYYPMNIDGELHVPTQNLSALLGLTDRLDNLFTLYAVGKTVTGSRDPYALRRQTIAIINILLQYKWEAFSIIDIFKNISSLYIPMLTIDQQEWQKMILDFIQVRLEGILKNTPYNYQADTLNAIFSQKIDIILHDIDRAGALQQIRTKNHASFTNLIELAKRISNILKDQKVQTLQESLLSEDIEKQLYLQYQQVTKQINILSYEDRLLELLKMEQVIVQFFDTILVKTGDEKEINRIALLHLIDKLFMDQADFSKLS